jgi:hypothetical protein
MCISTSALHLKHVSIDEQYGDIERTAAQVEDQQMLDVIRGALIKAIGHRCRRWFIDDTFNLQSGNSTGIDRRLTL